MIAERVLKRVNKAERDGGPCNLASEDFVGGAGKAKKEGSVRLRVLVLEAKMNKTLELNQKQ